MLSKSNLLLVISLLISINSITQATQVTWKGNNDPNVPEAAKVPRSQKYWDENNIERPDYAKTDAEIAAERRGSKNSGDLTGLNFEGMDSSSSSRRMILRIVIGALFIGSWLGIYRFGMMEKKGSKLGSTLGSNSSSNQGNNLLNYAMKMKKQDHETLEEKARKARLARFENKVTKED